MTITHQIFNDSHQPHTQWLTIQSRTEANLQATEIILKEIRLSLAGLSQIWGVTVMSGKISIKVDANHQ